MLSADKMNSDACDSEAKNIFMPQEHHLHYHEVIFRGNNCKKV